MAVAFRRLDRIEAISVHHSASKRSTTVQDIESWHKARGWDRVGYNYVVTEDGIINVTRSMDMVPAANRGKNRITIAICLTGNNTKSEQKWNEFQINALIDLIVDIREVLGRELPVFGHCELQGQNTLCPGCNMDELRARI